MQLNDSVRPLTGRPYLLSRPLQNKCLSLSLNVQSGLPFISEIILFAIIRQINALPAKSSVYH